MRVIGLFISFVSVILFVCFNNNIFLWRRFARSVLKIFFVFLFRDSFQLLVDVSIHSVYFIGIWVTWYACKLPKLPILVHIVILIFVRIIFDGIFYYFILRFNVSFQKMNLFFKIFYYSFIYECLVLSWPYRFIFCLISFCIRSHTSFLISFSKMSLIFWYLIFLYALSKLLMYLRIQLHQAQCH